MKRLLLVAPDMGLGIKMHSSLPPLGLMYLAAYTPESWEVSIVDENLSAIDYDTPADLVGISAITRNANRAYAIAERFRRRGTPVVIGGVHATLMPDEVARYADAVVVGEAEGSWPLLLQDIENGTLRRTYREPPVPLDKLRAPRRDVLSSRYEVDVLSTSRGCAFACEFCTISVLYSKSYRQRPIDSVLDELEQIRNPLVLVVDDNFLGFGPDGERRALELCRRIRQRGIRKYWFTQVPVTIASKPELLREMRRSGCRAVIIGIESIVPDNLRALNKAPNIGKTAETMKQAIRAVHRERLGVIGVFIVGADFDTPATIRHTMHFMRNAGVDAPDFQLLTPYPGTPLYERFSREGRLLFTTYPHDWHRYEDNVVYRPRLMSVTELVRAFDNLTREQCSRTQILLRAFRTVWETRSIVAAVLVMRYNLHTRRQHVEEKRRISHPPAVAGDAQDVGVMRDGCSFDRQCSGGIEAAVGTEGAV